MFAFACLLFTFYDITTEPIWLRIEDILESRLLFKPKKNRRSLSKQKFTYVIM